MEQLGTCHQYSINACEIIYPMRIEVQGKTRTFPLIEGTKNVDILIEN